jgi:1-acyl-sn-glycerol-3-phosphate acyltransferase
MKRMVLRHTVLRRMVTIPAVVLMLAVMIVATPVIAALDGLWMLVAHGRGRVVRIAVFALVYLAAETGGLLVAGWLWVRAGLGARMSSPRSMPAHYALLTALLRGLYAVGSPLFGLQVEPPVSALPGATAAPTLPPTPGRPLVVLSRHAGPGDSFLLVHALLALAQRRPRIVLKATLRFDPLIDVVVGRLPHCFVGSGPDGGERAAGEIGRVAGGMGPADALLVFPEGGNFTPKRRLRAIASLRRRGLARAGDRARRLHNVLPPQPAGVFAAVDAAPHADLVFVAHTGLDHLRTTRQVWRGIPLTRPVVVTWWTVPAGRVPVGEEARLRWLHENWAEVDAWIARAGTGGVTA